MATIYNNKTVTIVRINENNVFAIKLHSSGFAFNQKMKVFLNQNFFKQSTTVR